MTPTETIKLTPKQRDELAVMAGATDVSGVGVAYVESHYWWANGEKSYRRDWHPETSHDDCRPLLEEIERRRLIHQFVSCLNEIRNCPTRGSPRAITWWALFQVTPADKMEAFRITILAADKEKK